MAESPNSFAGGSRKPVSLQAMLIATQCLALPLRIFGRRLHKRMGAAPERYGERLGQPSRRSAKPVIWFHAASLGEVAQVRPLVESLQKSQDLTILVTTMSASGADWVERNLPNVIHQFVPLDIPSAVDGFLKSWSIAVAVFIEGDLWPRLVLAIQRQHIPSLLLNARHSKTRQRFPSATVALTCGFEAITCRSEQVASEFLAIGVSPEVLQVLPDLRITATVRHEAEDELQLSEQTKNRIVWLAVSTHEEDEDPALASHEALIRDIPGALLIIAPRYPRHSSKLINKARARGFEVAVRSSKDTVLPSTNIYVADTLGELSLFYRLASLAFVGGSFGDQGGHNPYEPAGFGLPVVAGPRVRNFEEAYTDLAHVGAAVRVDNQAQLEKQLVRIILTDIGAKMGQAGSDFIANSVDGIDASLELIVNALRTRPG